ncbi:TetR/AcrR family transcriptional regulator [Gracilibacillus kekensis]|uniref:Transcriptional regulator, TetR family n=1 Tax=Gracilibacillus kekensis TaxID=1027249 RepID=A0A1M7QGL4_9BACI|nr:TetR/AcrR family transcriptional regulator [Gracilibacillus kekensis]SHN30127.1 transcriptional regulator, TetR family [Gracilibacillus kekensis]
MRKGEKTKQHIIIKSAELFNKKGYAGSSMQDIINVTGLTKGGIYRRFSGKDEIAIEAFQYSGNKLKEMFVEAANKEHTALKKIIAICSVHMDTVNNPPIVGGCPLLNTAVESDDAYPSLRQHTVGAFEDFTSFIQTILNEGIKSGEFRKEMDTESVASFIVSALEGGVMASNLMKENKHVEVVITQLKVLLHAYQKRE